MTRSPTLGTEGLTPEKNSRHKVLSNPCSKTKEGSLENESSLEAIAAESKLVKVLNQI